MPTPRSDVFAVSLPKEGRRNEDVVGFDSRGAEPDEQLLIVVADGVSSSARGAEAATVAINEICASFRESRFRQETAAQEMSSLLIEVNRCVAAGLGGAGLCSFAAALWLQESNVLVIGNIGDSPAYFWDYQCLHALGHLDRAVEAMRPYLTQAVGQMARVNPNIAEYHVPPSGGILCVTSDGVLERRLEEFLREFGSRLTQARAEEFCRRTRLESADDTTLAAVRLGPPHRSDLERGMQGYASRSGVERAGLLTQAGDAVYVPVQSLADAFWTEGDEQRGRQILELMERHGGDWTSVEWTAFLDRCARERRRLLLSASRAGTIWINRREVS